MSRRRSGAVWAAGIVAGVGAGVVAERLLMRRELGRPDPERDEPLGTLPGEELAVRAGDGTRLHCRVVGPSGAPTLVFVHGITQDLTNWYYQWRDLSPRFRCVLYDQRGHGRSGAPPGREGYTIEALAEDLRAVLDATAGEGPVIVLGHSMGGIAVLSLADRYPQEFGGRIAGVVLISTTAGDVVREVFGSLGARVERLARPLTQRYLTDVRRVERIRGRVERTGSDFAYATARLTNFGAGASPTQVEHVSRIASRARPEIWAHVLPSIIRMDLRDAIASVRVPALLLVGDRDRVTPPTSTERLLRELPNARGVVFPGAGHLVLMERHAQVTRLIVEFVERALGGASAGSAPPRRRRSRRAGAR